LTVKQVAWFWHSFRNSRDLSIVGLMVLHDLRSREVLALNADDLLTRDSQIRVTGKGASAYRTWGGQSAHGPSGLHPERSDLVGRMVQSAKIRILCEFRNATGSRDHRSRVNFPPTRTPHSFK
jgi:hypothetical protein